MITGYSYHTVDRVIGTQYEQKNKMKRIGVPIHEIERALTSGKIKHNEKQRVTMYNTNKVSVRVNDRTGKIITVVPKGGNMRW